MDRQALLVRMENLKREVAAAHAELARVERATISNRIEILEGVLAETRRQVLEARKACATVRRPRTHGWFPHWPAIIAVLSVALAYHCR